VLEKPSGSNFDSHRPLQQNQRASVRFTPEPLLHLAKTWNCQSQHENHSDDYDNLWFWLQR